MFTKEACKEWSQAVDNFERAVSMKTAIEDGKKGTIAARLKRKRRGSNETKSLGLHCIQKSTEFHSHKHGMHTPYGGGQGVCI